MGTRTARLIALVLLVVITARATRVCATSFDPLPREQGSAEQEMLSGDTVFLFHSGTREMRRSLTIGDVLGVFRIGPDGRTRTVGSIRATAFVGEFCLRGEVVAGNILPHDVAEKNRVFLLVIQENLCPR